MTPQQFWGWSREHDWLPLAPVKWQWPKKKQDEMKLKTGLESARRTEQRLAPLSHWQDFKSAQFGRVTRAR